MECGQYNENWHDIHMYPEESVKAALDAKVKRAIPVHWAGFKLAQHHWAEPMRRFSKEADAQNLELLTPRIGEQFSLDSLKNSDWWEVL